MSEATMTGYELAKRLNARLRDEQLAEVAPQMIYNYMRNKLIATTSEKRVRVDVADAFIEKYVARKRERTNA
jgi:DNA-binding PadR family transcriptional regulator